MPRAAQQKPALVTTVAGTTSNSYVSQAFADDYFAEVLEWADWSGFSEADRCRALVSATRNIDHELLGFGNWWQKYDYVDTEQALLFPRTVDYNDSGTLEIPDHVEEATCLLALHMLMRRLGAGGPVDADGMREAGVSSLGTGGISIVVTPRWSQWPRDVRRLLQQYITPGGRATCGQSVRQRRWHEGTIAGTG